MGAVFEHPVTVRWRDTDALGHVNHAVFLTYLEEGRDAFYLKILGDPAYVVVRLEIDLRAEVFHHDRRLTVRIAVERVGTTSLTTRETIINTSGGLVAEARVVTLRWDSAGLQPVPFSQEHRAQLEGSPAGVSATTGRTLAPVSAVISFIDRINRGDADGLGELMTDEHELIVCDEDPVAGRTANVEAWAGYAAAYPAYVIHPRAVAEPREGCVAVLGHTTGSHLGLADDEERGLSLIWFAEVTGGRLRCWRLLEDTPDRRRELGLAPTA